METLDRYENVKGVLLGSRGTRANQVCRDSAWNHPELLPDKLAGIKRISRRAMSAPSSGSSKVHAVEQQEISDEARLAEFSRTLERHRTATRRSVSVS